MTRFVTAAVVGLALALAGCSNSDKLRKDVAAHLDKTRSGKTSQPYRVIGNFSEALGCMDRLLESYGVRGVPVFVEEIRDDTEKVKLGARSMLISALSDMTASSRALDVVLFGRDTLNAQLYLENSESKRPFAAPPEYIVAGSISSFSENRYTVTRDTGGSLGEFLSFGKATSASARIIGFDFRVQSMQTFMLVNGITGRNAVAVFDQSDGLDAEARYRKFAVNYAASVSKSDGDDLAVRNLIELSAVEIVGRLARVPYWQCLNAETSKPEVREAIDREVANWFGNMLKSPGELVRFWQKQLAVRGAYSGPVDARPSPALKAALVRYQRAMGLEGNGRVNLDLLKAYYAADHEHVAERLEPIVEEPAAAADPGAPPVESSNAGAQVAPAAGSEALPAAVLETKTAAIPTAPLPSVPEAPRTLPDSPAMALSIAPAEGSPDTYHDGDHVHLVVTPSADAHVACYLLDVAGALQRFFPNRHAADSLVRAAAPLALPGTMKFRLKARVAERAEQVLCFAAAQDFADELPAGAWGAPFQRLAAGMSPQRLGEAYAKLGVPVATAAFEIVVR